MWREEVRTIQISHNQIKIRFRVQTFPPLTHSCRNREVRKAEVQGGGRKRGSSFSFYQKNTMIRKQVLISISGERGRTHDEGPSLLCRSASQWNSCVSLQLPPNKGQAAWRLRSDWLTFRSLWPMEQLLCEEAKMGGSKTQQSVRKFAVKSRTYPGPG